MASPSGLLPDEFPASAAVVPPLEGEILGGTSGSAGPTYEDAVLKLKGLPYSTTEQQILDFFQDFRVQTVAFVDEPDGRPSGLAFAEFETKEEALKALVRNGDYIGERYVRLLHVPKSEMEEQVRLGTLAIPGAAAKLRSRLLRTQQPRPYAPQLFMPTLVQPGTTGSAVAMPHTAALAGGAGANAMPAYAASGVGGLTTMHDARLWQQQFHPSVALHQQFAGLTLAGGQQRQVLGVSHPASLMPTSAANAVSQTYSWQQHQQQHQQHQPVQGQHAHTHQQLQQRQHQQAMPSSLLSGALSPGMTPQFYPEGTQHLPSSTDPSQGSGPGPVGRDASVNTSGGITSGPVPGIGGAGGLMGSGVYLPSADDHRTIQQGRGGTSQGHMLSAMTMPGQHHGQLSHQATGLAPGRMASIGQVSEPSMSLTAARPGMTSITFTQPTPMVMGMPGGMQQQAAMMSGAVMTRAPTNTVAVSNPISATVKVRGLPYRSSPAEILSFFSGYQYLPDSLQLGLDSAGRPSGEAWLSFTSPTEAMRAVRELNRRYLGTRYLELSCC